MTKERKYVRYVTKELWEQVNEKNKDLLDKFLMGKRTLSDTSKAAYFNDMQGFFVYILLQHCNQYLLDLTTEDAAEMIDDYISFCASVLGNNERRLQRKTSSISSLYLFYRKRRKITENPVELLDRVRATQGQYVANHVFLTKEQVELVRNQLAEREKPDTQLELYFELGLYTMARVSAICSITLNQIDLDKKIITNVREKEGYLVDLFLSDKLVVLINRWLDERKEKGIESDLLFCTRNGTDAKSTIQIGYTKRLSEMVGVEGVTAHCLRRTGSNLRKQAGMALEDLSKLLNHKSTTVTSNHYVLQDFDKLRSVAEQFDI